METKMNVLLINPPLGIFDFIYSSVPTLLGQLNNNGINAIGLDLNVEFLREITSSSYLKKTKNHLEEIYNDISILNKNVKEKYKLSVEELEFIKQRIKKYLFPNKKNIIDFYIASEKSFFDEYLNALHLEKLDTEEENKK